MKWGVVDRFGRSYGFNRFNGEGAAHKNKKRRELFIRGIERSINCAPLLPPLNPLNPLNQILYFHSEGLLGWERAHSQSLATNPWLLVTSHSTHSKQYKNPCNKKLQGRVTGIINPRFHPHWPKAHLDFSYFPTLFRKQLRNAFCPSPASHHRRLALSDILLFLIAVYGNIVANHDENVKGRIQG